MIYLLYGEEYFLLKNKLESIIKESNIDNIISIDFESSSISNIINEVYYNDLFNSKKLIIVNNFTFDKLKTEDEEILNKYFNNITDNIIIFKCIQKSLDKRKNIIKKFLELANVYGAEKLDRYALTQYIKEMFKKEKLNITDDLIKKIVNLCGFSNYNSNNNYIFNEVNKLIIYKLGSSEITSEDIDDVIFKNTENEIFNLVNSIAKKDIDVAFQEFKIIKELNVDPFIILSSVSKQVRTIMQIKVLSENMSYDSIAKKLGIHPYTVEVNGKNASLYSYDDLLDLMDKIYSIDIKMKSENIDKYRIIEQFLIDLY